MSVPLSLSCPARPLEPLAERFVVVRFSSLGDVALITGVLDYWHRQRGLRFDVITREDFVCLFDHHPAVDKAWGIKAEDLHGTRQRNLFHHLADEYNTTALLDLHGVSRSRRLSRSWRGPVYHYPKHSLLRRLFLYSRGKFGASTLLRNNVPQRYVQALPKTLPDNLPSAFDLRPRLFLSEEEHAWAKTQLSIVWPAPIFAPIALHPFATHAAKTWPLKFWLDFAKRLDEDRIPYFWIGKADDAPLPPSPVNFINKTSIRQLSALLAHAAALVTGDSGPMHLAGGVDTPVLALFGPTSREWGFFPAGKHDIVLQLAMPCRPCSLHGNKCCPHGAACLTRISPDMAYTALLPLLKH